MANEKENKSTPYGFIYIITNLTNDMKYLGQRKFSDGWENYLGSGIYIKRAVKYYGKENFEREVIRICYSKEELNEAEYYYSVFFDVVNSANWYNLCYGGGATAGYRHTEESKKKMSEDRKGENTGENSYWYGKHLPEETKQKLKKSHGRSVFKISLEGVIICGYDRETEAAESIGVTKHAINKCCSGTNLTCGNFIWMYKDEYENKINDRLKAVSERKNKDTQFKKGHKTWNASGKILCVETGEIFNGVHEAATAKGVCENNISAVIHGRGQTAGGYHWVKLGSEREVA